MLESLMAASGRKGRRSFLQPGPTIGFIAGAAAGGAAALLLTPYSGRDLRKQLRSRDWRERLRRKLGTRASRVLSGDLPASVGGLSAGATGEFAADEIAIRGVELEG